MIYLNNTRELVSCKAIKADDLRVWAGLLSMVEDDRVIPPRAMISKRCGVRTSVVTTCLRNLQENGFLTKNKVKAKYISLESTGNGSVPFQKDYLKDFSRNRIFSLAGLRVFYYLIGDIRLGNKILETNITAIADTIGYDRANTSRIMSQFKDQDMITLVRPEQDEAHFVVSSDTLGVFKRM